MRPSALAAGSLGQALMDAGKTDEARSYLVRCFEIDERVLGGGHPQLIKDLRAVALLDLKTGNSRTVGSGFHLAQGDGFWFGAWSSTSRYVVVERKE